MKRITYAALCFCLFACEGVAGAQGGLSVLPRLPPGGYYINCPLTLGTRFNEYGYVEYGGHEWASAWKTMSWSPPLPSLQWYQAFDGSITVSSITSTDGRAKWEDPQVQVLCWVYNVLDAITIHYDPVGYRGKVVECSSPSSGPYVATQIDDPAEGPGYDPYATSSQCGDSGSGGSGGSGTLCWDEYVYIEVSYDDGQTWQEIWEGWAQVCM